MNGAGLSDALLIIDLQNGVCCGETQLHHLDELIIRVNQKLSATIRPNIQSFSFSTTMQIL